MALDRRVIYTKKVIKEALLSLLNEHPLDKITVKEICDIADINRATFYRYYTDTYNLFESIEEELIQKAFPEGVTSIDNYKLLYIIYENQGFYKEFFRSHVESPYIRKVIKEKYDEILLMVMKNDKHKEQLFRYTFEYMLHGILGLLKDWVNNGCVESPNEFGDIIFEIAEKHIQLRNKETTKN
ncbi:MAG: hypothetical protein K0S61_1520 [Anaerocolumna sp.]|jgi:AcrR family transcriptional regulator|nr:hypothetical protein [Anaerocolumna sp.]